MEKPFLPSDALRRRPTIERAALAHLLAFIDKSHPAAVAAQRWPNDRDVEAITKAATAAATSNTANWASQVTSTSIADFVAGLGPSSASAALFSASQKLSFGNSNSIVVPTVLPVAANASWIAESAPIPTLNLDTSGVVSMVPRKLACVVVFTRECIESSSALVVVRDALQASAGLALDSAMFDATIASATRPAGLRWNIAGLVPSAVTPPSEARVIDVANLVGAVSSVALNSDVLLIAAPPQAARLRIAIGGNRLSPQVLSSAGLAAGTVMAVAPRGIATAGDRLPRFSQVSEATVVEDTVAANITTAAVTGRVQSLFQADLVGLRLILEVSWARRADAAVAWMSAVTW